MTVTVNHPTSSSIKQPVFEMSQTRDGDGPTLPGLFDTTNLHIYTRDRHGDAIPNALELHSVEQVLNCGSWGEYARQRKVVGQEFNEKGAAWMDELKTDVCTMGETPAWHLVEGKSAANEHWLYHGTSLAGETGITEGDFRLNLAGSNAGLGSESWTFNTFKFPIL